MTCISGTIPLRNEWPSWSDKSDISNHLTLNYVARTGFWIIYSFLVHVHDWSYISYSNKKHLENQYCEQTTPQKLATGTKFIIYMCCTKFNCTCWHKGVNHASSNTKWFLWYLCWNPTTPKVYLLYVPSTQKILSFHDIVFDKKNHSTLAYTSRPYPEAHATQPSVFHIMYATSYHEQTGDIITILQFE